MTRYFRIPTQEVPPVLWLVGTSPPTPTHRDPINNDVGGQCYLQSSRWLCWRIQVSEQETDFVAQKRRRYLQAMAAGAIFIGMAGAVTLGISIVQKNSAAFDISMGLYIIAAITGVYVSFGISRLDGISFPRALWRTLREGVWFFLSSTF